MCTPYKVCAESWSQESLHILNQIIGMRGWMLVDIYQMEKGLNIKSPAVHKQTNVLFKSI